MKQTQQLQNLFEKMRIQTHGRGSPTKMCIDEKQMSTAQCLLHKNFAPTSYKVSDPKSHHRDIYSNRYPNVENPIGKYPDQKQNSRNLFQSEGNIGTDGVEQTYDKSMKSTHLEKNSDTDIKNSTKSQFMNVTTLHDVQAIRCADFHPSGKIYAVGSNSRMLRFCAYPDISKLQSDHESYQPSILFKSTKHHKGSVYCLSWNPGGDLIATGSNDKSIKLMHFNLEKCSIEGEETELCIHDGTIRDLCFIEDISNQSNLLVSGGAGDCKVYITDCTTTSTFQVLVGHTGQILALYTWGGAVFVSGSQDKTIRFWDLRVAGCTNLVTHHTSMKGSAVTSLCVDPTGRMLVSGHEDAYCVMFDIRGNRTIQTFQPHNNEIRSVRFSPKAYYLLTGGYDNKLILTDLQGDLTQPLASILVGQHNDKVICARWHPHEFSFISTSADKTATLWALPPI